MAFEGLFSTKKPAQPSLTGGSQKAPTTSGGLFSGLFSSKSAPAPTSPVRRYTDEELGIKTPQTIKRFDSLPPAQPKAPVVDFSMNKFPGLPFKVPGLSFPRAEEAAKNVIVGTGVDLRERTDRLLDTFYGTLKREDEISNLKLPSMQRFTVDPKTGKRTLTPGFEDALKSDIDTVKRLENIRVRPIEKIAAGAEAGLGGVNLAFAPVTVPLEAAAESGIPGISHGARGARFIFEKLGEYGAKGGDILVNRLPVSAETKEIIRGPIKEIAAIASQIGGAKVGLRVTGKLTERVSRRLAETEKKTGRPATESETRKAISEEVKRTPELESKTPEVVEVETPGGKINVETNQKAIIENFLKNNERVDYKVVERLGKDIEGRRVGARFEYDYKTGKMTIYTTNKTTAGNLAHELGHYFDHELVTDISARLSDYIPDYARNRAAIEASLGRYAVEQLGGEAPHAKISAEVKTLVDNFKIEIEKLSETRGETRGGFNEQFASAVAQVVKDPQMALRSAPHFAPFIQSMLKNAGLLETRIKNIAEQGKTQVITPQASRGAKGELAAKDKQNIGEPRETIVEEKAKTSKVPKDEKEYVEGKYDTYYRASTEPFSKSKVKGRMDVTTDLKNAQGYAYGGRPVETLYIDKSAKILSWEKLNADAKKAISQKRYGDAADLARKQAIKEGYDVVDMVPWGYGKPKGVGWDVKGAKDNVKGMDFLHKSGERGIEQMVINPDVVRTKADIAKEYKKTGTGKALPVKEVSKVDPAEKIAPEGKSGAEKGEKEAKFAGTGLKTGKFVEGRKSYNKDKINAPEDVEALFKGVSESSGEFKKQRISKDDASIKELAQEVGVSVEDLVRANPGSIANAETVFKSRQLVADLAMDLRDTIRKVTTETASKTELQEVKTKLFRLQASMKAIAGFRTEASNVFRQFKLEAKAGENDIMTDLVSALKKVDHEAGTDLGSFLKKSRELMEPTLADKAWHLWYMSILSGGSTHIKNVGGNLSQMIGEVAVEGVTNPKGFRTSMAGLYEGLIHGRGEFKRIMREGDVSKFEERGLKPIRFESAKGETRPFIKELKTGTDALLNSFDYIGRFMAATDAYFRAGFRGMELRASAREQAIKEGLKGKELDARIDKLTDKPLEEMIEQADQFAARGTYTQKPVGLLGILVESINKATSIGAKEKLEATESFRALKEKRFEDVKPGKIGKTIVKGVARTIVPFSRIVANVVNNSIDWTPAGFLREGLPSAGASAMFGKGKPLTRPQRQQLGRAAIGTVGMMWLASMAEEGRLSGNGPSDSKKRQQLKDAGWRENAIRIGDTWYPYQNWGPMAVPMTLVGNYFDSGKYGNFDEDEANERLTAGVLGSVKSVLDMSFLSGLADLVEAVQNYDRGGEKYIKRYLASQATSPVPNLYKQTRRYFDTTQFETNSVGEYIRYNLRITGGLKPRLNVFGQPIKGEALTELQPVKVTDDQVIRFLNEDKLWVSVPGKTTKIKKPGKESRVMDEDEYYNYVKISGRLLHEEIRKQLGQLKAMSADKRQDAIDDIVRDARADAKRRIELGIRLD